MSGNWEQRMQKERQSKLMPILCLARYIINGYCRDWSFSIYFIIYYSFWINMYYQIYKNVQSTTATVKLLQGCSSLWDPVDCSPAGSTVHGILQAILEWIAIFFFKDLPNPGTEPTSLLSPVLAGGLFLISAAWEAHAICPVQVTCIYSFRFTENVVKR